MIEQYKYTDKEQEELLKSMVVLVDTREKENTHILEWFDKKKVPYKKKALKQGDYSFYIPKNDDLNIPRDIYFDRKIVIERKHNLDEIAGNFTQHRNRFEEEFAICPAQKHLIIENANYQDIVNGNYKSNFAKKSFLASLHTFEHRYNLRIMFIPDEKYSAYYIYGTFFYYLKNGLH